MFICNLCSKVSNPKEKVNKVLLQTRPTRYTDKETGRFIAEGTEIVKEVNFCKSCFDARNGVEKKEVKKILTTKQASPAVSSKVAGNFKNKSGASEYRSSGRR